MGDMAADRRFAVLFRRLAFKPPSSRRLPLHQPSAGSPPHLAMGRNRGCGKGSDPGCWAGTIILPFWAP
jgi:hypothetical protein